MNCYKLFIQKLKQYCDTLAARFGALVECGVEEIERNSFLSSKLIEANLPNSFSRQISETLQRDLRICTQKGQIDKTKPELVYIDRINCSTFALFSSVVDVCYIHMNRLPSFRSSVKFINRYMLYNLGGIMESKYKDHTSFLVSSLLPPTDIPIIHTFDKEVEGVIIGGWVRRFFESSNCSIESKVPFAMALQAAKRGALAISDNNQFKSVLKHQKTVTGQNYNCTDFQVNYKSLILQKVDELVKYYYPKNLMKEIPIWRVPSSSSCYERKVLESGALGTIIEKRGTKESYPFRFLDGPKRNITLYSRGLDLNNIVEDIWSDFLYREEDPIKAVFHKVLEPFKVRGITAAEAEPYQLGRLLQPVLHSHLKDPLGPFRFIGKYHSQFDIAQVYDGSVIFDINYWHARREFVLRRSDNTKYLYYPPLTFFVAGDYSSATDNMIPEIPTQFCNSLQNNTDLSDEWITLCRSLLGPHLIDYQNSGKYAFSFKKGKSIKTDLDVENREELLDEVLTSHGQLMGSPLSFPVLCISNAACLWASIELYENRKVNWGYVVEYYRPLINGDDISFGSNPEHYECWKDVCGAAGFILSPGKNYKTRDFVNINSTNFICDYDWKDLEGGGRVGFTKNFRKQFILNAGLVKGQAKVLSDTRSVESSYYGIDFICDQFLECVDSAIGDQKERLQDVFFFYMKDKLSESFRSWSLPKWAGGLGLTFLHDVPNHTHVAVALGQIRKYKDLSDITLKTTHQSRAMDYENSIVDELVGDSVFPAKIVHKDCEQPVGYDLPSLAFLYNEDCSYVKRNENRTRGLSVVKVALDHPESKFIKAVLQLRSRKTINYQMSDSERESVFRQIKELKLQKAYSTVPLFIGRQ